MPDESDLTVPADVPWRLLSRRGPDSAEDPTSLATFAYVPLLPELDATYPEERLVYFKFSASVFPFRVDLPRVPPLDVFDEAVAPVWRMVLDVRMTGRDGPATPGLKPYFLSAAPTRRALIETGVVGDYLTEGESDEVAVGRSGSHLIEGFHSTTKTRKFGGGISLGVPGVIGGSVSRSGGVTSISGGREVSEQVDTTVRQASDERKELLSHMTNVSNVMTLLTGSLVGTGSLRFSLWPQPLRPLSVDPSDENLWYAELLRRRSSGIEGMQDFYAVAVLPRGEGFCLRESLRRVSVLEPPLPDPPVRPFVLFDDFQFNLDDFVKVFAYLSGKYPQGTPLEELDVSVEDRLAPDPAAVPPMPTTLKRADLQAWRDAVGAVWVPNPLPPLPDPSPFDPLNLAKWVNDANAVLANLSSVVKIEGLPRPVVSGWTFSNSLPPEPSMFRLHALTVPPSLPVPYKWVQDVWLEAAQYEYEAELARSPLERGTLLVDDREVDICAAVDAEGAISDVTTTVPPAPSIGVLGPVDGTAVTRPWDAALSRDPRSRGRAMATAWGMAEARLGSRLSGAGRAASLSFQEVRAMDLFLRRSARLESADRRNLPLAELGKRLGLSAQSLEQLKVAEVTNLASLAKALLAALEVERLGSSEPVLRGRRSRNPLASRVLPPVVAREVIREIGAALDAALRQGRGARPQPGRAGGRGRRRRGKATSRR
jgi:hypothetical protein